MPTARVPLSQGLVALVDQADLQRVLAVGSWHVNRGGESVYAQHSSSLDGRTTHVSMHRFVLDAGPGQEVDHVNHDGLDNRRANLRLCGAAQNQANQPKAAGASSRFKGVTWRSGRRRWEASIKVAYRTRFLGRFGTEEAAARAYDAAAVEAFGTFAVLNFGGNS
jgi:hypothetical protein